jgi:hypothetical protein
MVYECRSSFCTRNSNLLLAGASSLSRFGESVTFVYRSVSALSVLGTTINYPLKSFLCQCIIFPSEKIGR